MKRRSCWGVINCTSNTGGPRERREGAGPRDTLTPLGEFLGASFGPSLPQKQTIPDEYGVLRSVLANIYNKVVAKLPMRYLQEVAKE